MSSASIRQALLPAVRRTTLVVCLASCAAPAGAQQPTRSLPPPAPPVPGVRAQPAPGPRGLVWPAVRDESFASRALGAPMKYRVVLPPDYPVTTRRYPTLYLLHGLTGGFGDWESRTGLVQHLRGFALIVVMPDAKDSWYADAAGAPNEKYETAVGTELVEEIDARFRTIATRHGRAVAGLSMGGYGALKLALKQPQRFAFAGSLSGALGAAHDPEFGASRGEKFRDELTRIFGPPGSDTRAAGDLFALATALDPARAPFLYLDCGTEDGLLASNREFVALIQKRGFQYEYRELPGAHTWDYWDRQLRQLLGVLASRMSPAREAR